MPGINMPEMLLFAPLRKLPPSFASIIFVVFTTLLLPSCVGIGGFTGPTQGTKDSVTNVGAAQQAFMNESAATLADISDASIRAAHATKLSVLGGVLGKTYNDLVAQIGTPVPPLTPEQIQAYGNVFLSLATAAAPLLGKSAGPPPLSPK